MNCRMLKEMLTERDGASRSYSQSRIYLMISVVAYYLTLAFATIKGLRPDITIDVSTLNVIIEALQWAMMLFAGYTFGGKGLEVIKTVMNRTPSNVQPQQPKKDKAPADNKNEEPEV